MFIMFLLGSTDICKQIFLQSETHEKQNKSKSFTRSSWKYFYSIAATRIDIDELLSIYKKKKEKKTTSMFLLKNFHIFLINII